MSTESNQHFLLRIISILLFFTCFHFQILAQESSKDSVRICFVKVYSPQPEMFEYNYAVNGRYRIPPLAKLFYPELPDYTLIYPHRLLSQDGSLNITSFRDSLISSQSDYVLTDNARHLAEYMTEKKRVRYIRQQRDGVLNEEDPKIDTVPESFLLTASFPGKNETDSLEKRFSVFRSQLYQPLADRVQKPFAISNSEVTNAAYRRFVHWVRDSIAIHLLYDNLPPEKAILLLNCSKKERRSLNVHAKIENLLQYGFDYDVLYSGKENLYENVDCIPYLDSLYRPLTTRFYKRREWNTDLWVYASGKCPPLNVFPDTLCWLRDSVNSLLDPLTNMYFWHPAYNDFPVVGVSLAQMQAYCDWLERRLNEQNIGNPYTICVKLPELYHYEMAVQRCVGPFMRETVDVHQQQTMVVMRDVVTALGFVRRCGFTPPDVLLPDDEIQRRVLLWYRNNQTSPVYDLTGSVSEYCSIAVSDSTGGSQMYVVGGNRYLSLINQRENPLNTTFYLRTVPHTGSSTTGFRTILYFEPAHE